MQLLAIPLKIAAALGVNYLLFILFPVLHALFGGGPDTATSQLDQRRLVAQIVKKEEKKKEKKEKRRIRQVRTSRARRDTGRFNLKFSPDLGAMGGAGVAVAAHEAKAVIFNEGETDENPIPLRVTPVPFPEAAKAKGLSGDLILEISIGRRGQVESVRIIKSPHPMFSTAARRTVRGWTFRPGRNKGVPVRVRARKVIEFRLDR